MWCLLTFSHVYFEFITLSLFFSQVIRDAFQEEKRIEIKESIADLVTETDKKVEQMIISKFKSHFPDHRYFRTFFSNIIYG